MRFISVAERELRAASRHVATYRIRWVTAASFLGLLLWMLWAFDVFSTRNSGPTLFRALSAVACFYCLLFGTARTADCLSSERREGTLGLLILTNLNSAEIVAGKLCSSALASIYGLLAAFPVLALPLLMGGVTFDYFWRVMLSLINCILFSVAAGFLASSVCVRQFPAVALATGLTLLFTLGLIGLSETLRAFRYPIGWVDGVAMFSPLYSLMNAEASRRVIGANHYWHSILALAALSCSWLGLVAWRLAHSWRDRPKARRRWMRFGFPESWRQRGAGGRTAFRRRLLGINPFFWLGSRQQVSAPVFMALVMVLISVTVFVAAPFFRQLFRGSPSSSLAAMVFSWVWLGLAIHALVLYYAAAAASQRLAEDKQSGALELILSTPISERTISRGLWLAYGRKMLAPALIAISVHLFFVWQGAALLAIERPDDLPAGLGAGGLLWAALVNDPVNGSPIHWSFYLALRVILLLLVLLVLVWLTLGSVGRWLGLRMKYPGFAPLAALVAVIAPPVFLFSVACWVADEWSVDHLPERQFLPLMMWIAFGIGSVYCGLLSLWAAGNLRRELRATVTRQYQPALRQRWWRPAPRAILRFTVSVGVLVAALALIITVFFGYQNWRSHRNWALFQRELKQQGRTLELSAVLPPWVADEQNFARAPVFQSLLNRGQSGNRTDSTLLEALRYVEHESGFGATVSAKSWAQQGFTDFKEQLTRMQHRSGNVTNRGITAALVLEALRPLSEALSSVAVEAQRPFFQFTTNRNADAVIQGDRPVLSLLERIHFLLQLRASALVALDRPAEAAEDTVTSLRLARLATQSLDTRSAIRAQYLASRSLQPIWEGLAESRWDESQLRIIQDELARVDLLTAHTNAIHRTALAHIELWRQILDRQELPRSVLQPGGNYVSRPVWEFQPRAWWLEHCVQLYQAGQRAIQKVDGSNGRVSLGYIRSDVHGLPLDGEMQQVLQGSYSWSAAPVSVAFAQNAVNQAILACALERYRLTHGAYPESLRELVPDLLQRLPNDVVRGRPMIYERLEEGRFILRGVGPNETDDRTSKNPPDDWLWKYPTNAPALR